MTWFKVDDGLHSHKKVVRAGVAAMGLWVIAGSWCADNLTDGFIPDYMAARLDPDYAEHAARLVAAGFWTDDEEDGDKGWRFRGWTVYQPSREEAIAERDSKSMGGKVGNHRRWHVDKGVTDPKCTLCSRSTDRITDHSTDRGSESVPNRPSRPDPTRPDPTRPVKEQTTREAQQRTLIDDDEAPAPAARASTPKRSPADAAFEEFYSIYPRREARVAAEKAWAKAVRTTPPARIILGAKRFRDDPNREDSYTPHPATWLNQGRWTDEPLPPRMVSRPPAVVTNRTAVREADSLDLVAQLRAEEQARTRPQITGGHT
jgi:hypothetical protein